MKIEIYSIKSFSGNPLKTKLEKALKDHRLPFTVRETNIIDDFIKAGLSSVPVIKVGNIVIEYNEQSSIDETIQQALNVILRKEISMSTGTY
jgi:hypothetical protein